MSRDFTASATELALKAVGHRFPRLTRIAEANGAGTRCQSVRFDMPAVNGFSYFLLDVTRTEEGRIHLIEANGSNAALSSSVAGRDDRRSRHMYATYRTKKKPRGQVVCLLTHQKALMHFAEFYLRAGLFAQLIDCDQAVELRDASEDLGDEEVSVVVGAITDIAPQVQRVGDSLFYRGRVVGFACNPNILPELVRRGTVDSTSGIYNIDDTIFHEGHCTPVIHDKGLQQELAEDTKIIPLRWAEGHDLASCLRVIETFRSEGLVVVGKMNAGSGGAGIQIFTPEMSMVQCSETLNRLANSATEKHGSAAHQTLFPVRFFEFAKSAGYSVYGKPHLWDLRLQCLVQPGFVEVAPCVIRLCPEPFDGSYRWDTVVSNLSGRDPERARRFLRSPFARRRSQPGTVLEAIGMTDDDLSQMMEGCAQWCAAAWEWGASARNPSSSNIPAAVLNTTVLA